MSIEEDVSHPVAIRHTSNPSHSRWIVPYQRWVFRLGRDMSLGRAEEACPLI